MFFRSDQSFAGILAFVTPIAASSYKSFPLISLSVISVRDGFNEITNDPLYLCPVLLNFNYAEVVTTKILPFQKYS
jgi:hypothetical protein